MSAASRERSARAMLSCMAAFVLGGALQVRDGLYNPWAVGLLILAIVLGIGAVLSRGGAIVARVEVSTALRIGVLLQLVMLLTRFPGQSYGQPETWRAYSAFLAIIGTCIALTVVHSLARGPRTRGGVFVALVLAFVAAGVWIISRNPAPHVDVFVFQRDSAEALARGENPYRLTFRTPYTVEESAGVYGPGMLQDDGTLGFGFPYMPLTGWWNAFGHSAFGDYRIGNLLAMVLAALCVSAIDRFGEAGQLAALLLLFTPRGLYLLEQGFTEPLTVMLLSVTAWTMSNQPRAMLTGAALGLLVASKQYAVLVVPLTLLVPRWSDARFLTSALAAFLLVTAPLAVWDWPAFAHSALWLQFWQPFRPDALSVPALMDHLGLGRWATLLGPVMAFAAMAVAIRRLPAGAGGWGLGAALTLLAFFAFSKQAFANYYAFVIAGLCVAAVPAAWTCREPADS